MTLAYNLLLNDYKFLNQKVKMKKYALILFSAVGFAQQTPNVTVIGEGSVTAIPDIITFSVSVETEGKTPNDAKKGNDQAVRKIIDFLQSQKLSAKDYQTNYVNLYKERKHFSEKAADEYFVARHRMTISLTDVKKYDDLIVGLLGTGITNIDSIDFGFLQKEKYMEQARINAIKNAKQKAETYAKASSVSLGKVLYIAENYSNSFEPAPYDMVQAKVAMGSTIAIGERELKAQVKVVYELK